MARKEESGEGHSSNRGESSGKTVDASPMEDALVKPLGDSTDLATETMARLYEAQGFFAQAERARRGLFAQGLWEFEAIDGKGLSGMGLSVEVCPDGLLCRWRISEDSAASIRAVFPRELLDVQRVDPALRVAALWNGNMVFADHWPVGSHGVCRIVPIDSAVDGALVALGMRCETGRFVPAFHKGPLWLKKRR